MRLVTSRPVLILLVAPLLALPAIAAGEPIDPKNPRQGRFSDEWSEIYLGGGKVGYAHMTMAREGERIQTGGNFYMKVGRADQPVILRMAQGTVETLDGAPLEFSSEMDASVMKSSTKGTVAGGKVAIVTSQYGMTQTQTFDYPAGALMGWGMFREQMLRGFKPGTQYSLQAYAPELRLDGAITAKTVIGDWEEFAFRGKTAKGQKVTVTMESPVGSFEMISWVDKDGVSLRARVPMAGIGDIEMISVDQATALGDFVPPELFMSTVVKAGRKLDPSALKSVKYRIRCKTADTRLGELPDTDMQKVVARDERSAELVLTRRPHAPRPGNQPGKDDGKSNAADLAEFLESNLMINTADPKLIELAKQAAGGEKEPFALGDKLRRFVTDYVTAKSLNIGFATASEVARTKEGDCSEHGVLLAALGRINGLPSRVAVGLAYVPVFGRQDDIFGYHMWAQFYIDGRWVDFDAALRESDCSPTRIAFATSSMKSAGLADLSLPLLNKIGAIEIDILDVQTETASPK